jgi:adenine-specific DNA-methyltransferase
LYESQAEEPAGEGANLQARVLDAWLKGADFKPAQPPKGLDPALLARNAQRYVRKNTQDFFVHPQLGEFLRGELEVYLKHEFVHVWDAADAELPRIRAKFKLLRSIALDLIAFLDQIEQFQATLFEKRKFVLQADYLVQCSWLMREAGTVGQTLVQEAAANAAQAAEWAAWVGDKPTGKKKPKGADLLRALSAPATAHAPLRPRIQGPRAGLLRRPGSRLGRRAGACRQLCGAAHAGACVPGAGEVHLHRSAVQHGRWSDLIQK